MSLTLTIDPRTDPEVYTIDSSAAWRAMCLWADGLDFETYPHLQNFAEFGYVPGLGSLGEELAEALEAEPPADAMALESARWLAELLEGRDDEGTSLVVTE